MKKIREVENYSLITALTEPSVHSFSTEPFQRMERVATMTYPGSENITHFLEPSDGCGNEGCPSKVQCYAGKEGLSVPAGNIEGLYKQQFEEIGTRNVGFFTAGYCEPVPENEKIREITKTIFGVMLKDSNYRPEKGMRFQTQSPMVVADRELLEQIVEASRQMPFYVGISAPNEDATRMFGAAEILQDCGVEVQLCAAPAKPKNPVVYAKRIAGLNPASVLYEPQHAKYDEKGSMAGGRIIVPTISEFRDILRNEGYKGAVENKNHTFTLITPSQHLN